MSNLLKKIVSIFTEGHQRTLAVKRNVAASIVLKGLSVLVTMLLVPATIGYVSDEIYGVWLAIVSVIGWFNVLDIGLTPGLKNKLTEALAAGNMQRAKALVSTTYLSVFLIFLPIAVAGYYLTPYIDWCDLLNISPVYKAEVVEGMQMLCLLICVQMTANVIVSVLAAYQRVAYSQTFTVIGNVLAYFAILILTCTVPPSLPLLVVVLAGMPIATTIAASVWLYLTRYREVAPSLSTVDFTYFKGLFNLGIKFFIINIQAVVVYQSTYMLIAHVSSPQSVTAYNIAYRYLSMAMILYNMVIAPIWPAYTDAYAKGDVEWMRSMRQKMLKVLCLCSLLCICFAAVAQPFYHIWVGNKADVPQEMTWMVALYVIVYGFMTLSGTFLVGIGKVLLESIVVVIGACVYLPGALFAARYLHEYGILLALIILNIIYAVIFDVQTRKIISGQAKGIWLK